MDCTEELTPRSSRSPSSERSPPHSNEPSTGDASGSHGVVTSSSPVIGISMSSWHSDSPELAVREAIVRGMCAATCAAFRSLISRDDDDSGSEASERSDASQLAEAEPAPRAPLKCNGCGKVGHGSWACRDRKQCRNCGCYGHTEDDCGCEVRVTKCYKCRGVGHIALDCLTRG